MSLLGHLGPGVFMMLMAALILAHAIQLKWVMKNIHVAQLKVAMILVFAVPAILLEISFAQRGGGLGMTNTHHLVLYAMLLLQALMTIGGEMTSLLPHQLVFVYEGVMFISAGLLFSAHNMGNPLFVRFHMTMEPLLMIAGLIYVVGRFYNSPHKHIFLFVAGLVLQVAGQWFFHIGIAFYLYTEEGRGIYGSKYDEGGDNTMTDMAAHAKVNFLLVCHVMSAFVVFCIASVILKRLGLAVFMFQDDAFDRRRTRASSSSRKRRRKRQMELEEWAAVACKRKADIAGEDGMVENDQYDDEEGEDEFMVYSEEEDAKEPSVSRRQSEYGLRETHHILPAS